MIPASRNKRDQRMLRIEEPGLQNSSLEFQNRGLSELRQSISLPLHEMVDYEYPVPAERSIVKQQSEENQFVCRKHTNLRRRSDHTFPRNDQADHTRAATDHFRVLTDPTKPTIDHGTNQLASPDQGYQGVEPDLAQPGPDAAVDSSEIASLRRLMQKMKNPPKEGPAADAEMLTSSASTQTEEDYYAIKKNLALMKKPKTATAGKFGGNVNRELMDFNRHLMNLRRYFYLLMVTVILVFLIATSAISYTNCVLANRPHMTRLRFLIHSIIETVQKWIYGYSSDNFQGRLVRCANRAVLCPWPVCETFDWACEMVRNKMD